MIKAGLALLTGVWFTQACFDSSEGEAVIFNDMVQNCAKEAISALEKHFELIHKDVITTEEQAKEACKEYKREDIDCIILVNLIYSGDETVIEIMQSMKSLPVLMWSFNMYKRMPVCKDMTTYFSLTGAPGMLQACAPLKRMGIKFDFVLGVAGDPHLDKELADWACALDVAKKMRRLKIGSVGKRYEPMSGAWIDELKLKTRLGPHMVWMSSYEYSQEAKKIPDKVIEDYLNDQKKRYRIEGVDDESLEVAARSTIGMYNLAKKHGCEVMAMQDMDEELNEFLGCRPHMTYQKTFEEGIMVGMEADIISAFCTWILYNLCEGPAMYVEILTYDEEENFIFFGHASTHDLRLAGENEITIMPDLEFMHSNKFIGAWHEVICKPGKVTLVAMFEDNDCYRFIVSEGEVLDRGRMAPGYGQAVVHTDIPIAKYMKDITTIGVTQHFSLCYGDIKPRLKILADHLAIEYIDLDELNK